MADQALPTTRAALTERLDALHDALASHSAHTEHTAHHVLELREQRAEERRRLAPTPESPVAPGG